MATPRQPEPPRPLLFTALALSIPAFYLVLTGASAKSRDAGSLFYGLVALMIGVDLLLHLRKSWSVRGSWAELALDAMLFLGALGSAWPTDPFASRIEWLLRLAFSGLVLARLTVLLVKWLAPRHLLQVLLFAGGLLAVAGEGFYWLEPKVLSYADGLWLAFVTAATVGYGDLVPSTPGSRIFAGFIVLLGYAVFSVVTATIAAIFVGEDEKRLERELHADIRSLRQEIAALRDELRDAMPGAKTDRPEEARDQD